MPNSSEMCVLRIKKDVRDKLNEYRIRKIVDWKHDVSMEEALDDLLTVELEYDVLEDDEESEEKEDEASNDEEEDDEEDDEEDEDSDEV